ARGYGECSMFCLVATAAHHLSRLASMAGTLLAIAAIEQGVVAQRIQEAAEPNASVATATPMSCGQEAVGSLSSTTDEDWFRIVLPVTSDLRLQTGPSHSNAIGDT